MSSFLKPLKGLARIATMERSDENRYERQRANANAKQEAFICSDHQFCSGFRVHESHSLLFSSLVSLFWVQFRATLLAFPVLFWVQGFMKSLSFFIFHLCSAVLSISTQFHLYSYIGIGRVCRCFLLSCLATGDWKEPHGATATPHRYERK